MSYLVFFDLETGGVRFEHPNIQLAAVVIQQHSWREIDHFETKIRFPEHRADPEALKMNHYTREAWANAPSPVTVCAAFSHFLKPFRSVEMISKRGNPYEVARLAGHNAASFDGPRLMRMFKENDEFLPADPRVLCTQQLAMWRFQSEPGPKPKDFKLTTLCEHFGVPTDGAHDALFDVRLSIELAKAILSPSRKAA